MYKVAPLPGTFMLTSIIGFFISILLVMPIDVSWGFAFALVFLLMFISGFISMAKADADAESHLDALAFHKEKK